MQSPALTVQESLKRDPHAGDLFRAAAAIWSKFFGTIGSAWLYAKRLDRSKLIFRLAAHDFRGAAAVGRGQNDACTPHVFLWPAAIRDNLS